MYLKIDQHKTYCCFPIQLKKSPTIPSTTTTKYYTQPKHSLLSPQAFGGKDEIAAAGKYPLIRLFTADLKFSASPQAELISIEQSWSVASPGKLEQLV